MRIISGSLKGRKILDPKDLKTRPLKDLTKESIFNIIKHSNKFSIKFPSFNFCNRAGQLILTNPISISCGLTGNSPFSNFTEANAQPAFWI